jgi:hypothetical protein
VTSGPTDSITCGRLSCGYRAAYPAARCYGVIEAKTGFTREARAKAYRFAELAIGRQAIPLPPAGRALASRCPRSASRR